MQTGVQGHPGKWAYISIGVAPMRDHSVFQMLHGRGLCRLILPLFRVFFSDSSVVCVHLDRHLQHGFVQNCLTVQLDLIIGTQMASTLKPEQGRPSPRPPPPAEKVLSS